MSTLPPPPPPPRGPRGPTPAAPPPPGAPGAARGPNVGAILLLVAGVLATLLALGPWLTADIGGATAGRDEYEQLWLVLVLGLAVGGTSAAVLNRPAPRGLAVTARVLAGLLLVAFGWAALEVLSDYLDFSEFVDPGWAALLSPLLPVAAVAGALLLQVESPRPTTAGGPVPPAAGGTTPPPPPPAPATAPPAGTTPPPPAAGRSGSGGRDGTLPPPPGWEGRSAPPPPPG